MKNYTTRLKARACEYIFSEHPFFESDKVPTDDAWAEWYDQATQHPSSVDFEACHPVTGDYIYILVADFEYYEIPTALVFVYNSMAFAAKGLKNA